MRRFLFFPLLLSVLIFSPASAQCPPDAPLLKVDGHEVDYSYFKFVEGRIPEWALKKFYSGFKGREKLLEKIAQRQMILAYYERKGYFNDPLVKAQLERFKVKRLVAAYLDRQLSKVKVSSKELQEALSKYPPSERASLKRSVEINLKAHKYMEVERKIYSQVERELRFLNLHPDSPSSVVATFKGRPITFGELKPLIKGSPTPSALQRAAEDYALYLKAVEEGLDKTPKFRNELLFKKESMAVRAFEAELRNQVKVSDSEIKEYYEKHKKEFRTPAAAVVSVYPFESLSEARKALERLRRGLPVKEAVPGPVFNDGKRFRVEEGENNPVAELVFSEKKRYNLLTLPNGKVLLVVVEKRIPSRQVKFGDAYSTIKDKLLYEKEKELLKKKLSQLKKLYPPKPYPEALTCLGQ